MVNIEQMLSIGIVLLRLVVILLVSISTIIISQLILKRWLWPAIKKTKIKSADKIFRLFESVVLSVIILQSTQAAVRLFSESFSLYAGLVDSFFFLLYWSIGHMLFLA